MFTLPYRGKLSSIPFHSFYQMCTFWWIEIWFAFGKISLLVAHPPLNMAYSLFLQNEANIYLLGDIKLYGDSIKIVYHKILFHNKTWRKCQEKCLHSLVGIEY